MTTQMVIVQNSQSIDNLRVQVRSRDDRYKVSGDVLQIPALTNRTELNQMIKVMLKSNSIELEDKTDFIFYIDDKQIINSVSSFLEENKLEKEILHVIEFEPELPEPQPDHTIPHPDWIGAVQSFNNDRYATGCFDGSVSVFIDGHLEPFLVSDNEQIHTAQVNSICWLNSTTRFISASDDGFANIWEIKDSKIYRIRQLEHYAEVKSLDALGSDTQRILTAGVDRCIRLWIDDKEVSDGEVISLKRKKRTSQQFDPKKNAIMTLKDCHSNDISSVRWISGNECASASWDQSIKLWDINSAQSTHTFAGNQPFLSIDYSPLNKLLIASSTDHTVRLYDPTRCSDSNLLSNKFTDHRRWVYQCRWCPSNEYIFCSADGIGNVRLWDIRYPSIVKLHICRHKGIVFALNCDRMILTDSFSDRMKLTDSLSYRMILTDSFSDRMILTDYVSDRIIVFDSFSDRVILFDSFGDWMKLTDSLSDRMTLTYSLNDRMMLTDLLAIG
ncbi:hypothetical protein GJ496_003829 [Pomphorhynchus laevis]|nr:hypothetical protein GJ496_003829 [Pomphorhynchus laevis]